MSALALSVYQYSTFTKHHLVSQWLYTCARACTHLWVVWSVAQSGGADSVNPDIQDSIEMWMLLEYADKGNLEQAIQQRRFALRSDPSQLDMVRLRVCEDYLCPWSASTGSGTAAPPICWSVIPWTASFPRSPCPPMLFCGS